MKGGREELGDDIEEEKGEWEEWWTWGGGRVFHRALRFLGRFT